MFASRLSTAFRRGASTAITRSFFHLSIIQHNVLLTPFTTRPFSQVTFTFIDGEGEKKIVTANEGQSLLDVAHEHDVELEGACGGEWACSTCHLVFEKRIFEQLPEMSEEEEDMLDLAWGLTNTSRLGCQIGVTKAMEGMTVQIPDETDNLM
ncbi:unnamed protein product [Peronospora effusa]|nr:unnamed protein product [Peronospora effusa]